MSMVILPHPLIQKEQLSVSTQVLVIYHSEILKPAQEKCEWVNWLAQHDLNSVD